MNLIEKVRAAGVVGAGGAGFPTHVKYNATGINYFIANAAECEPLLYVDQQIMDTYAVEFLEGVSLIMNFLGAKKSFIATKKKYREAIAKLEQQLTNYDNIQVHAMENFYPAGDEFVMVFDVLGLTIPEGGLPLDVGAVVNNVLTIINVARASRGIPVTDRYLTVHGEVNEPMTIRLPLGTSYREAIELAGGIKIDNPALICGGPMMGDIEDNWDSPVTKTTSGLLLLPPDNYLVMRKKETDRTAVRRGRSTCDQCMYCTEYCPRYIIGHNLRPHKSAMRGAPYGIADSKLITSSWLCCECKLCDYFACPLFLSPGKIHGSLKREMGKAGVKNTQNREQNPEPRPFAKTRRVPVQRLVNRLQLDNYMAVAPFKEVNYQPSEVRIPLKQHIGVPAMPTVKPGDEVRKGDLIGEIPQGQLGARVHASIDGTVTAVDNFVVIQK
ncbi:MAG: SLBB domain-containing protein [Vulcanimicrobiota bacterium]